MGIKEIAKAAGVSQSTVSNVLNGRKNVGESTRKRVLSICEESGYNTEIIKKKHTKNDSKTLLFSFSDFDRQFYLKIIQGISDCAQANGYDVIICTSQSCLKFMSKKFSSGCIMLDMHCSDEMLMKAASSDYPIITLDRDLSHPFMKSMVVNNYTPMCELMENLVDRGYRSFAFLAGLDTTDTQERYVAFKNVLDKHGIPFDRKNYMIGDFREKSGYRVAKLLMMSAKMPEVLVCANDNMAVGAMRAFREKGVKIPKDIAITGFDGTVIGSELGLTTVDIPNYERGYLAAQYLIDLLNGNNDFSTFKINANVLMRSSVASR